MTDLMTFTVPLSWEAHELAREFSDRQFTPKRSQQIYFNILAVYAVNFYLQCMEIETDCNLTSNLPMPGFAEFTDLELKGIGTLECCPVLADDRLVQIPPEVWVDRMGYIAVQFNDSLTEAKLVGFVKTVTEQAIPLHQFKSLEIFLADVYEREESATLHEPQLHQPQKAIKLSQWLQNQFEAGWETVESIFAQPQLGWRGDRPSNMPIPAVSSSVTRAKVLDLGTSDGVALLVELMPTEDLEIDIWVKVHPLGECIYLPEKLTLTVLDEEGMGAIQAEARRTENIQVKFSADLGEKFGVKISLQEVSVTEAFLV